MGSASAEARYLARCALLDDLHRAIQGALRWDDDHLWCFYLDGKKKIDTRFIWPDTEGYLSVPDNPLATIGMDDDEGDDEGDDEEFDVQPTAIGDFGFARGTRLIYRFDFGSSRLIPLKVKKIDASAGARKPSSKPLAVKGKRPAQYRW